MAGIAFRGGRNMRGRFADRHRAIVATAAHAEHLGVIDSHRRAERRGVVTRFARVGGGDMGVGFSGCAGTVVTGGAAVDNTVVSKPCG